MSPFRFLTSVVLALTIFLSMTIPAAHGHGGGHGGFGYGGHHGFGYGGHHGFHGFGYGYGYPGFGFGYPFFGGFGYPGFGFGGMGYGLYGLGGFGLGGLGYGGLGFGGLGYGGLGYGGLGYGGLGYGGLGLGGLGYGGLGFRGLGYGGYRGFSSSCNCCCVNAYPLYGASVPVPVYNGGSAPAKSGGDSLPMPKGVSSRSRYVDYYARNTKPATLSATVSSSSARRYVDYYTRRAAPSDENRAHLHVNLPADAELWLNGQRMHRTGAEREFITPQLQEGETYAYQIKARWTQEGQPQEETLEVKVRANKTTNIRLGTSSLAKR